MIVTRHFADNPDEVRSPDQVLLVRGTDLTWQLLEGADLSDQSLVAEWEAQDDDHPAR